MPAGLISDEERRGFTIDVGEVGKVWEELEQAIEGSGQRIKETKKMQRINGKPLSWCGEHRSAVFHSPEQHPSDYWVSHIKG